MKLDVIIEKDETGFYVAEVPALPGCFSQGVTFGEAEVNIKEAIELWLEVMHDKNQDTSIKGNKSRKKISLEI
ncbi:MAG: type II toxin-antitoxin system HicB family antitoxin [Bacteroidales bacterium]|nr:type II toxin-antitoxin system HicB family antitoxin [Bacteroidales bacterium]